MERHEKIKLLQDIAAGKASIDQLQPQINLHRLTVAELYLILNLYRQLEQEHRKILSKAEIDCLEYYRKEANNRPLSKREQRGFAINGDFEEIIIPGSDNRVEEWYQALNLKPLFPKKYRLENEHGS